MTSSFWLAEVDQPILEPAFAGCLGELRHQARGGDKQHRVAGQDRLAAKRHGQMRLADAGRAQEEHRLAEHDLTPQYRNDCHQ